MSREILLRRKLRKLRFYAHLHELMQQHYIFWDRFCNFLMILTGSVSLFLSTLRGNSDTVNIPWATTSAVILFLKGLQEKGNYADMARNHQSAARLCVEISDDLEVVLHRGVNLDIQTDIFEERIKNLNKTQPAIPFNLKVKYSSYQNIPQSRGGFASNSGSGSSNTPTGIRIDVSTP